MKDYVTKQNKTKCVFRAIGPPVPVSSRPPKPEHDAHPFGAQRRESCTSGSHELRYSVKLIVDYGAATWARDLHSVRISGEAIADCVSNAAAS